MTTDGRIQYALDEKATHMGGSPVRSEDVTVAVQRTAGRERAGAAASVFKGGDPFRRRVSRPAFRTVSQRIPTLSDKEPPACRPLSGPAEGVPGAPGASETARSA